MGFRGERCSSLEGTFGDAVGPVSGVPSLIAAKALRLSSDGPTRPQPEETRSRPPAFPFSEVLFLVFMGSLERSPPPGSQET